ncbi:acyl-CoA dehydrogenase [Ascosphaera apis ARSEF 7405]|uniref:Acyl-CoA dehydrogenase n=1 Tax=Ascosphaera apis ARSEF 7405 TaxID=392613 RepID=A0A168AW61_9EURO|nr:acyl-CoA dehydrogenase [Ascosphaera apis ARSEF 7405]
MPVDTNNPIPFSEPAWLSGLPSPYYNDSHRKWHEVCHAFCSEHFYPNALEWEDKEDVPLDVYQTFAKAGFLPAKLPAPLPVEEFKRIGITHLPGGLKIEDYDVFHGAILSDNLLRTGLQGPAGAITTGIAFGTPPIINFGSRELKDRLLADLMYGRKRICIAITEPNAGSDVANIETTAEKTPDGKFYIVNGAKKWITNGIFSDYATMAVRTGGPGAKGISLLVVPLTDTPGVTRRRIHVMGLKASGTTYIDLDNVKVPASNLIGKENNGMKYIMTNFNHERIGMCFGAVRQSRVALGAAVEYAMSRTAFNKTLMDQPVVRARLANAGVKLETLWAYVEQLCYQMKVLPKEVADVELGGKTAMAKAYAGQVFTECATTALLIFGGNGLTRTGKGELIEKLYRDTPGIRIPGGSEDVLMDLAIRQLVKIYQMKAKMAKL